MIQKYILALLLLYSSVLGAQDSLNSAQWFNKAQLHLFNRNYGEAATIYKMLLEKDKQNKLISFHLSICYLNMISEKDHVMSIIGNTFGESYKLLNASHNPTLVYLGKPYSLSSEFLIPNDTRQGFQLDPNQPYTNICVSENGNRMVYMNNYGTGNQIFFTQKENGTWLEPKEITFLVGTAGNFFPSSLSFDGTRLYLTKYDEFESDIYVCTFNRKTWSAPKKMNMKINSMVWDSHACESADGTILYFSSSRSGGFGGMDIYFSNRAGGDWGEVYNLGAHINTFLNEEYPLVLNEGKTLLFASQGFKKGKDGYDMYYCHRVGENIWTEPENLGPPVNTPEDDITYVPMIEECRVFFSKTISKNPDSKPNYETAPKFTLAGILTNYDKKPASDESFIEIQDALSQTVIKTFKPATDGTYTISLVEGAYILKFSDAYATPSLINIAVPLIYKNDFANLNIELKK